jgi:hypothetical protein
VPLDLERVDALLQVSARERDRIDVDEQPFEVPDVSSLRAGFGKSDEPGEASSDDEATFSFARFADPVHGPTLRRTLDLFLFVNRARLFARS